MKLTIFYDGQFYVGLIETISDNKFKAYRFVFGTEPNDHEVLDFIYKDLQRIIEKHEQNGIPINNIQEKKMNPKRLQRKAAKELKQTTFSSKAQEALNAEYELRKKKRVVKNKQLLEKQKQYKRDLKVQKAKNKRKGK